MTAFHFKVDTNKMLLNFLNYCSFRQCHRVQTNIKSFDIHCSQH